MFKVGDKFIRTADHLSMLLVRRGYEGVVEAVRTNSVVDTEGVVHDTGNIIKGGLEELLAAAESEVKSLREQIKQRDARPPEAGDIVTYGSGFYDFKVVAVDGSKVWLKTLLIPPSGRPAYVTRDYKIVPKFKVIKRSSK